MSNFSCQSSVYCVLLQYEERGVWKCGGGFDVGTESAACYKMELERPGGRTREEVDVEWQKKSRFLKEFG